MLPHTEPTINIHIRIDRATYRCSWCGGTQLQRIEAVTEDDGTVTYWVVCLTCDNQGRRQGEPAFDPIGYPRWNVLPKTTEQAV